MINPMKGIDMPKTTFTTRVAECGHSHEGYIGAKPWPRCPDCMTAARLLMQADNQRRARIMAEAVGRSFKVSKAKRLRIYERDLWVCQLCSDPVDPTLDPESDMAASLDHIVCRSWGGNDDDSNLRLAHRLCNARRGDEGRWLSRLSSLCAS